MRCVCGYEKISDREFENKMEAYEEKKERNLRKGYPAPDMPENGYQDWITSTSTFGFEGEAKTIYACPECGTLKISMEV